MNWDLIVIGGGSAGMAAALEASKNGIEKILILENESFLGGILMQCIHSGFGLATYGKDLTGPEFAYNLIKEVKNDSNITVKLNTFVQNITKKLEVTFSNDYDGVVTSRASCIVNATGCYEKTRGQINIPGTRPKGVMSAGLAQKYINLEGYKIGKKAFILGSGDIGLIMARRLVLEGVEVLGVAEIMPYSSGLTRNIVQCLDDYNIPLYLSHTVKEIIGNEKIEKIIISKVDENFNFIDNTDIEIELDCLLLSVGLIPLNDLLINLGVEMNHKTKGAIVDSYYQTSIPGIFSCGNALHVHDLVDFVVFESRQVGLNASLYIKNKLNKKEEFKTIAKDNISYLIPNAIRPNEDTLLKFRVSKPFNNCFLEIKQNNKTIYKVKKQYMLPSLMNEVKLKASLISSYDLEVLVYE